METPGWRRSCGTMCSISTDVRVVQDMSEKGTIGNSQPPLFVINTCIIVCIRAYVSLVMVGCRITMYRGFPTAEECTPASLTSVPLSPIPRRPIICLRRSRRFFRLLGSCTSHTLTLYFSLPGTPSEGGCQARLRINFLIDDVPMESV